MFLPLDGSKSYDTGITCTSYGNCVDDDWTRDWQTFWAILLCSIILILAFISIKHKTTQLTDNGLVQILAYNSILLAVSLMSLQYGGGGFGFNPAIATGYVSFAVSQYAYPNIDTDSDYKDIYGFDPSAKTVNHYLWVYILAPLVGGAIAGILHLIHQKCVKSHGKDNDSSISVE